MGGAAACPAASSHSCPAKATETRAVRSFRTAVDSLGSGMYSIAQKFFSILACGRELSHCISGMPQHAVHLRVFWLGSGLAHYVQKFVLDTLACIPGSGSMCRELCARE